MKSIFFILFFFIFLFLVTGCDDVRFIQEVVVTDIVEVTGRIGDDYCIVETNKGKLNLKGDYTCSVQIGDHLVRVQRYETMWWILKSRHVKGYYTP